MTNAGAVGVFDSGVGGLSVLRELRRELPAESFLYLADSAHAPYGEKSAAFIETRALALAHFLVARGVKAMVVACNTATSAAIATLRARFSLPIVGMEPAVKPAAGHTRSGVVGVLATTGTVAGDKFASLLARFNGNVEIVVQSCPGLVEQVEAGDLTGEKTRTLIERYVAPLLQRGADTIVLGCTHYPFLRPTIERIAGQAVAVIDPGAAVASELRRRLVANELLCHEEHTGTEMFWTSAPPSRAQPIVSALWGKTVAVMPLPPEVSTLEAKAIRRD